MPAQNPAALEAARARREAALLWAHPLFKGWGLARRVGQRRPGLGLAARLSPYAQPSPSTLGASRQGAPQSLAARLGSR
jgi:hypothetical protein